MSGLDDELAELERTDPAVRAASRLLDEVTRRIIGWHWSHFPGLGTGMATIAIRPSLRSVRLPSGCDENGLLSTYGRALAISLDLAAARSSAPPVSDRARRKP